MRWKVGLLCAAALVASCDRDDRTFRSFDGYYRFSFKEGTERAKLDEVATTCGQGHGVESTSIDSKGVLGQPAVVVNFNDGSIEDQERVALCAERLGSFGTVADDN